MPAPDTGKAEIEDVFGKFMTAEREARTKAGRPMVQGIAPWELKVQMAGPGVAVVSFHLGTEETPSRHTVVFRNDTGGWKVIHWHASSPTPVPNQ